MDGESAQLTRRGEHPLVILGFQAGFSGFPAERGGTAQRDAGTAHISPIVGFGEAETRTSRVTNFG
jgi:hypothetical protein